MPAATTPATAPRAACERVVGIPSRTVTGLPGVGMPTRGSAGSTACTSTGSRGEPPRLLDRPRRVPAGVPLRALDAAPAPRADPARRPGDPRVQPPLVPRPVPHRLSRAPAGLLRRQARALPHPPDRLDPRGAGGVPDRARPGRREGDGDGAG